MGKLEYQSGADHWTESRSIWDRILGPDRRKVWRSFAREIGGHYSEWGLLATPVIVAPIDMLQARLDRVKRGGRSREWHLRCRVRYWDADGFRFSGSTPAFFNQPEQIERFFSRENRWYELVGSGRMLVAVRDINWWFGWKPGRAELCVRYPADTRDIQELRAIFDLTKSMIGRLRVNGSIVDRPELP